MFAYGGEYEDDVLVRDGGLRLAEKTAAELGIDLKEIPEGLSDVRFRRPVRTGGSDQAYFIKEQIPYVYFEANAWVDAKGNEQHPNGFAPFMYNSRDPAFSKTEGQIFHTEFDDVDELEKMVPGRMREHLNAYSRILTSMIFKITPDMVF